MKYTERQLDTLRNELQRHLQRLNEVTEEAGAAARRYEAIANAEIAAIEDLNAIIDGNDAEE